MKHQIVMNIEGEWRDVIVCESKLAGTMERVRANVETGAPVVLLSDESTDGSKFRTSNMLRPITPAVARVLAEKLLLAADEAEKLARMA